MITGTAILQLLLKILGNKWTYVILVIIMLSVVFGINIYKIKKFEATIVKLNEQIEDQQVVIELQDKEITFQEEQIKIFSEYYTNSLKQLNNLKSTDLPNEIVNLINIYRQDYLITFGAITNE